VIYRSTDGQDSRPFEFPNTRIGFDSFHNQLLCFRERYHANDIVVGFKSTGVYTEPLVHYLRSKEMRLVLVNPVHIKRIKKIQDNSPNKTDKKDPRVIADLIELGCVLSVIFPEFNLQIDEKQDSLLPFDELPSSRRCFRYRY